MSSSHTLSLPSQSAGRSTRPETASCATITGMPSTCLNSTEILRGQKAVEINHNGLTYRLQATRLGKLILTK
jgi:hemin uptake protein HemP